MRHLNLVIREFVPNPGDLSSGAEMPGGILSLRTDDYSTSMTKMNQLAGLLISDALLFKPPLEITTDEISMVVYGGDRINKIPGVEAVIPSGHFVSQQYIRRKNPELVIAGS